MSDALSFPVASKSTEEKDTLNTIMAIEIDALDMPKEEYPQRWKLWLVYIATLLTMFLVGLDFAPS